VYPSWHGQWQLYLLLCFLRVQFSPHLHLCSDWTQ